MSNKNNLKFTINNFRIFDKLYTFELAPITILTGPNNSGKSSLVKALLMLKNDKEIPLKINLPNKSLELPKVQELLNKVDELFDFTFSFSNLHHNFQVILSLQRNLGSQSDSNLYFDSLTLISNDKIVFDIKNDEYYDGLIPNFIFDFSFWMGYLRNKLSAHNNVKEFFENKRNKIKKEIDYKKNKKKYENVLLFELELEDDFLGEISLESKLKFNEIQNNLINDIHEVNDQLFDHFFIDFLIGLKSEEEFTNSKKQISDLFEKRIETLLLYFQYELYNQIKIQIPGNYNLKQTELYFHFKKLSLEFSEIISFELSKLTDIQVLPVSKGNSSRYIQPDDFNLPFISKIVMKFYKSSEDSKIFWFNKWINKWLGLFELGKSLKIKNIENRDIYTIEIVDFNDESRNIKDLGFGVSQIVSLLLSPFNADFKLDEYTSEMEWELNVDKFEYYDEAPVFYLEEPESNLHPNWQSLLMELITEINQKFGIRFIIETHSEYMIRKLQNLVSKKIIKKDEVKIYYFNSDKNVSKEEPKVKEMILREDGILATSFGPGFFDEAVKLTVELLKIENYN